MPYIELVNARQVELETLSTTIEYRRQWAAIRGMERTQSAVRRATRRDRAEEFRAGAVSSR